MDGNDGDELLLKLQRDSRDLIKTFQRLLPRFLWKTTGHVRRLVRESKTWQLARLLEPFQEDPQLLDPHLAKIAASLVEAFLAFLKNNAHKYHEVAGKASSADVVPLPRAVSKILYTLCKIRGPKVIIQLLSSRPQQLEPLLDAFELWNREVRNGESAPSQPDGGMVWEERYIMLLWMSHLSQIPFDLASLTSRSRTTVLDSQSQFPKLPDACPVIATRLITISCCFLGVASKEREAAVKLFTRMVLLGDLQRLGVHQILLNWASRELKLWHDPADAETGYRSLGLLSFLADFVSSASSSVLHALSDEILDVAQWVAALQSTSALVEKSLIKLYRGLALHCGTAPSVQTEALESAITFIIGKLAADETSVRFAASKGLAKLTSRLDQDLAMQIIDTVLDDLQQDFITPSLHSEGESLIELDIKAGAQLPSKNSDFRNLDARKWHGLMLTVSHFILQRSIPASELIRPIKQLIQGLKFNQKNTLGYSVGANVRDAACLGLWALARKYSTSDISRASETGARLLQTLANELVVAALLDPAGNIRRGAAAALQEMVGRHPDTIECGDGLALIQFVDYHAVASRKNAMEIVSIKVMALNENYWKWLLHGLLGWRGVKFEDTDSRRKAAAETRECAAKAMSSFATISPRNGTHLKVVNALRIEIRKTTGSQISAQHGLLWAMARVLERIHEAEHERSTIERSASKKKLMDQPLVEDFPSLWTALDLDIVRPANQASAKAQKNNPYSSIILQVTAALVWQLCQSSICENPEHHSDSVPSPSRKELEAIFEALSGSRMTRLDQTNAKINANAIEAVLQLWLKIEAQAPELPPQSLEGYSQPTAPALVNRCFDILARTRGSQRYGALAALAKVLPLAGSLNLKGSKLSEETLSPVQENIIAKLVRETTEATLVEMREFSLFLLCDFLELDLCTQSMLNVFGMCLSDYTMDQQKGDVGSRMRIAAAHAIDIVIRRYLAENSSQRTDCIAKVCGLAVEKLDRVRLGAFSCVEHNWVACGFDNVAKPTTVKGFHGAEVAYFETMLLLCKLEWPMEAILGGFVTTAGGEYEAQIFASRSALVNHTAQLSQSELMVFCNTVVGILQKHSTSDRLLISTLEVIGFLFEAGITIRLDDEGFDCKNMLDLVKKTHIKSKNLRKLESAVRIYCNMVQFEMGKISALTELCKLLKHPFPRIRNAAADALLLATGPHPDLLAIDWARPVKENAGQVGGIRARLVVVV